jgi:branched-chain amino acid transport system substrate-binding protein
MKRAGFIALAALLVTGGSTLSPAQQSPIKIGLIAELSGPQATLGQDQYDAFMMVVERNGGKLGGVPVEVIKEDSQLKPEVANQIVQRLIEKDNVSIITGLTFSNIVMAVHKAITDKQVFLIGSNAGPSPVAGALCSPYQFFVAWQTDMLAEVIGQYANDKGYKRMYLMAPNYQAGKDFLTGFKRYFKGQVLDEVYTPLNQVDFSAELTQLAAAKPDAIFVFYPGGLGINFVRQYQQMGLLNKVPLLTGGAVDGSTLPALRETALGSITSAPWSPDLDNPANKKFVEDFEAKFKRIPAMFAAQSYDAAQLLDSAIAQVKGNVADKPAFMAALKSAKFQSVRGDFKFGNNNFPIQDYHVQEVAKDAKGRVSLKTIATPFKSKADSYHQDCKMN